MTDLMTEKTKPEFWMTEEPLPWASIERYAKNNDEFAACLLSLKSQLEIIQADNASMSAEIDDLDSEFKALNDQVKDIYKILSGPVKNPQEDKLVDDSIENELDLADQLFDKWKLNELSFNEMIAFAAQWGANRELDACCEWLIDDAEALRVYRRRPKDD